MKKLIISILCFSILFNSFIGILSKTVYAVENNKQKTETIESDNNNKKDKINLKNIQEKINFKDINKAQIATFTAIGIGTIMLTKMVSKMCCQTKRGIDKLPTETDNKNIINKIIEEEEEEFEE